MMNKDNPSPNLSTLLFGSSVYSARAIASNWTDQRFDNTNCDEVYIRSDKERLNADISIYPNPTTGTVYVSNVPANGMAEVYNAMGSLVMTKSLSHSGEMDISALHDGLYTIKVIAGDNILTKQVIKIN